MSRTHILLIFLLLPLILRSQEDIYIGKKQSLYSTALQENRKGTGFVLYRIARRPELLDTPAGAL